RLIVHAAEQVDMRIVTRQRVQLIHAAAGFLDGGEIGTSADPVEKLEVHHSAGPAGIVVEHHRQVGGLVDRQCMIGKLELRGNGIVWRSNQDAVVLQVLGDQGVVNAVFGADGADARNQRHPSLHYGLGKLQKTDTFVV